jgi:hypothetical protein
MASHPSAIARQEVTVSDCPQARAVESSKGQSSAPKPEQTPTGGLASTSPSQSKSKPPQPERSRSKKPLWVGRAWASPSQQSSSLSTKPGPGGPHRPSVTPSSPKPSLSLSGDQSLQSLDWQSVSWLQGEPGGAPALTQTFPVHTKPVAHWALLVHWTHWPFPLHTSVPGQRSGRAPSAPHA